ncbi:MAG: hypothetical protein ACR2QF_11275 [Geminicoccaceae bacterium]
MIVDLMTFVPTEPEDDINWPKYSDEGFIVVEILGPCETGVYNWEYEVQEYDELSCVLYINEGTGFEWWLDNHCEFPGPGKYRIEGIKGEYIRGDRSYGEDDDEHWEFGKIIRLGDHQ